MSDVIMANSSEKMVVNVVDSPMGCGKSTSAINYINSMPEDERVIYVAPYNTEGERIQSACEQKDMIYLQSVHGSKLNDLRSKLKSGNNVVSTHSLLARYTDDVIRSIAEQNYTLIIDEAYEVTRTVTNEMRKKFSYMLEHGSIQIDEETRLVSFVSKSEHDAALEFQNEIGVLISSGAVYYCEDKIVIWVFPIKILNAFKRIIVMTYMIDAQPMYYYLKYNGYELNQIGARQVDYQKYEFCKKEDAIGFRTNPAKLIDILVDRKLNSVGDGESALSVSWYKKALDGKTLLDRLAKNVRNVAKNRFKAKSGDLIWTTYGDYRDMVQDKNIKNSFVACNARATNNWREATKLIYAVDIFAHPDSYNFFKSKGYTMDLEKWALSSMVQWIWRSAIRDGKPIQIYIPSERMRRILIKWLNTFKEDEN